MLLKNKDEESNELETCESLLVKIKSNQDRIKNPYESGKSKGKQKGAKIAPSANIVKLQVCLFLALLVKNSISRTGNFWKFPITQIKSCFPSIVKHYIFTLDFSISQIFQTNFHFPGRFRKIWIPLYSCLCCFDLKLLLIVLLFYCRMHWMSDTWSS